MRDALGTLIACLTAAACAGAPTRVSRQSPVVQSHEVFAAPRTIAPDSLCSDCAPELSNDVRRALLSRIADLRARGGDCAAYANVLDRANTERRITVKPYMWRVGRSLASGEAKPNGEMTLARDIDSLNVGVRTLEDVMWSLEHEAVHLALGIPSGIDANEWRVDGVVRGCRSGNDTPKVSGLASQVRR